MTEIFKLNNSIKPYEWGSPDCIPDLLGFKGGGGPQAELWMGTHPGSPSLAVLPSGEVSLGELIAGDPPRYLGEKAAAQYGVLPFLFKLLAAEKPLSVQAHPNKAQAREGFERENRAGFAPDAPDRCYRDSNHKPEIICALTPFTGMCGFRDPVEIRRLLEAFLNNDPQSPIPSPQSPPERTYSVNAFRTPGGRPNSAERKFRRATAVSGISSACKSGIRPSRKKAGAPEEGDRGLGTRDWGE
jgi:mannose-6-phosphate isomerase class I